MNRYWNPAGAANWNLTSSWSDTDGGATGASVPTIDDDVFFTGTNVNNCTINSNPVMKTLTTSGYTGTITQDTTATRIMGIKESITSTGTLKLYGKSEIVRLMLRQTSTNAAVTTIGDGKLTINVAGIETAYVDFENCIGAGTADWDLTKQATDSSGDCGGNSNITFTTAATQTFTNADGGAWNVVTNWSGRVPLPQDDCNLGIAYNDTITVVPNMARLGKNIDFTGATWTTSLTFTGGVTTIFGSITFQSGMSTLNTTNAFYFRNFTPATLTTNGVDFRRAINIVSYSTVSLSDDLTATGKTVSIRAGTFDTNGYALNIDSIAGFPIASVYLRDKTHTFTGGGPVGFSGAGLYPGTSTIKITKATGTIFILGNNADLQGVNFYNVLIDTGTNSDPIQIAGNNTFNKIINAGTVARTIYFHPGSTQTFNNFEVSGSAGNVITINSGIEGVLSTDVHYLVKNGKEEVECDYLNIQHSVAMPPKDVWFAGENSVNNQADATAGSGWEFRTCQRNWIDLSKFNRRR